MEISGRTLTAEFPNWAEQANGSVLVRYGETIVLATAVMSKSERAGVDFFPLSVDYEEKFYAAGAILGSRFIRRESRPSEDAILTSRLIDRAIRPLFNTDLKNEIQIIVTALSIDEENDPDTGAVIAASLAIAVSDIPWNGPVSGIRIGYADGKFIVNPSYKERLNSSCDIVVCGKDEKINMIETEAEEINEEIIINAFETAIPEIEKIQGFQKDIVAKMGRAKIKVAKKEPSTELISLFKKDFSKRLEETIFISEKATRNAGLGELKKEWFESVKSEIGEGFIREADKIYEDTINNIVHQSALKLEKRVDSRKLDELRELTAEAAILPRAHGSGLFMRGETHILSVVTLGAPGDELLIEGMETRTKKRFMHHYNFPPFSVGETKPMRGPGRREIGHGALAEKALRAIIPNKEDFPYIIRIVSETLSSNGSSSMGSVCASSLALMDAGVPIKNPAAGISMGLMMENEKKYKILADIQGPEDHHGDMDFKAAGTRAGITAIQMDVKVNGVTVEILKETLEQAKKARIEILEKMAGAISEPRKELSPYAPKISVLTIPKEKIGEVIGSGGKTINGIIEKTGVKINIEDDGTVYIAGTDKIKVQEAADIIKSLTKEFEVGEKITGKVVRILDFGAMVELSPKQDGLIHISKLAPYRVNKVSDIVKIGDAVEVQIINIDEMKRIDLKLIKKL